MGPFLLTRVPLETRPVPALRRLIAARVRSLRNRISNLQQESLFKIIIVAGLGMAFWVSLFLLFDEWFRFLNEHAFLFRDPLVKHILSLFFLTLLFMLVFSNALISFSNLFKTPETAFLFSLPIRHDTIYLYKTLESLAFSSWAFFALGIPLLLAYGRQSGAPWLYYPGIVAFMVPFVLIPAGLGAMLGLLLTSIIPRHRGKTLGLFVVITMLTAAWITADIVRVRGDGMFGSGAGMQAHVQLILGRLQFTQHVMTPNYWITHGLLALSRGGAETTRTALTFFFALTTSGLFLLTLGWFLAGSMYAKCYSYAAVSSRGRQLKRRSLLEWFLTPVQRRWPYVTVLVIKDTKTFLRDPVQWCQVLIFFGLLTIYIANIRNFGYRVESPFYQNLISFLNLGATSLTLATMISRFVFPLISLEGQRFWVLGLVPVRRRRILIAKFVFSLVGALLITETLVLLSNLILQDLGYVLLLQTVTAALISVALTGMAVGMGALFPSLREQNPSKIVSGFGGTLTLILSISLVLLIVGSEALVCHRFLVLDSALNPASPAATAFRNAIFLLLGLVGGICLLAAYIPMRLGARALERLEF